MQHSNIFGKISLKALSVIAALMILVGGIAMLRPAYAEEEDTTGITQEDAFDGECAPDEGSEDDADDGDADEATVTDDGEDDPDDVSGTEDGDDDADDESAPEAHEDDDQDDESITDDGDDNQDDEYSPDEDADDQDDESATDDDGDDQDDESATDEDDADDESATDDDDADDPDDDAAYADLTYESGMGVFSAGDEAYLRETDGEDDEPDEDEFHAFYVEVKGDGQADLGDLPAYYRVDGGTERPFSDVTQEAGNEARYHIDLQDMAGMTPGLHEIEVYVNDEVVHTDRFYVPRDWDEIMPDPSAEQVSAVAGKGRSTYVVYYPQFENTNGITEYAIDFSIDDMNRGTYFSTFNAEMDTKDFEKKGLSITDNYGTAAGFYGGFQYLEDGRRGIIMTVWDVFCKDEQGNKKVLKATPLYADDQARLKSESEENSGEGDFQQFTIDYPWEAKHPYRVLLQLGKNDATGNTTATLQVCDLTRQEWKKLVTWDLGYTSEYIRTDILNGFLENYLVEYSGDVRSANFSNIRGRSAQTGEWKAADGVKFTINNSETTFDYIGSYSFGADDNTYYAITSGVDGLCPPSQNGSTFSVKDPTSDKPY